MAEETFQHIPWLVSQPRNRQTSTNSSSTASVPSLAIEAKTTTSTKPLSPSRPSPLSKTTPTSPTEKPRGVVKRTSKTASLGSRDGLSRPSTGTMNDLAGEVTYTPTTHRISKAKKGKKVHACEYPGCPKVRLFPNPLLPIDDLAQNTLLMTPHLLDLYESRASQVRKPSTWWTKLFALYANHECGAQTS